MAESSERQQRIDRAMGEMMYQCAMAQTEEEREADKNCSPFASLMQAATKRHEEISNLNDDEVALLKELCSFFDSDHAQGNEVNEVKRAREIIEELQMNVNFQALPYGETFLNESINHSLGMMKMLLEKGADVNLENEMEFKCALDSLLEMEDDCELTDEEKQMKKLLLEHGAKTAEERLHRMAEMARKSRENCKDDDSGSGSDDDEEESEDEDEGDNVGS